MYKVKASRESFEEVLQQAYDELEPQDIIDLLNETSRLVVQSEFQNDFIFSIGKSVAKNRNISFKQWKALSAYVDGCRKKIESKNNKSF
jgi:hypothetical protein